MLVSDAQVRNFVLLTGWYAYLEPLKLIQAWDVMCYKCKRISTYVARMRFVFKNVLNPRNQSWSFCVYSCLMGQLKWLNGWSIEEDGVEECWVVNSGGRDSCTNAQLKCGEVSVIFTVLDTHTQRTKVFHVVCNTPFNKEKNKIVC